MGKYTDGKIVVVAKNYEEAAEKIFGQEYYPNPNGCVDQEGEVDKLPTTYTRITGYGKNRHCEVKVYKVGDKQGSFWGVQAAEPKKYMIKKIR